MLGGGNMKRFFSLTTIFLLLASLSFADESYHHFSGKPCHPPKIPEKPSADELMEAWFDIKFTRYADDVTYTGGLFQIDKSGFKRTKKWIRKRIVLHGKRGLDYKDVVIITYPEYTKGLAILTWAYLDVNKQNDIWLWLPAWKKIRKVSQAEEDDSFMGSEFTVEEITTRRYGYETYKLIGEDIFPGYKSELDGKIYCEGIPCYKVEGYPKKKGWYYSKRVVWMDKKTGVGVYDEYYDKKGKKYKEVFRYDVYPEDGCWWPHIWEVYNFKTGHRDIVHIKAAEFNTDVSERFFTEKTLERQEW